MVIPPGASGGGSPARQRRAPALCSAVPAGTPGVPSLPPVPSCPLLDPIPARLASLLSGGIRGSSRELCGVGGAPMGSGWGNTGSGIGPWGLEFMDFIRTVAVNGTNGTPDGGAPAPSLLFLPPNPSGLGGVGRVGACFPPDWSSVGNYWLRWELCNFGTRGPVPALFTPVRRSRGPQNEPGRSRRDTGGGSWACPHPPPSCFVPRALTINNGRSQKRTPRTCVVSYQSISTRIRTHVS